MIEFFVSGAPVPKQSFRYGKGRGFKPARVQEWEDAVTNLARFAMRNTDMLTGHVAVELLFSLPHRRRVDLDNLSKAVLDACNEIIWEDDRQVVDLHLRKRHDKKNPGVSVKVRPVEGDINA